jgi:transcriptional regulator with XRE-family HTH domain
MARGLGGVNVVSIQPGGGPTVLRIMLGARLRNLREGQGISREDAGYTIRASGSKISRMELGRVSFKERDIADLLTLYGVEGPAERAALVDLAQQANSPGWWHKYGDVLPDWFQVYVGLEEAASLIRLYEVQFVPGLLQTPGYTRAVVQLGRRGATQEEIEHRVSLRQDRQRVLARHDPPRLWVVIDEAALRRPIGGPEVMRRQIERLIDAGKEPHVTIQVLPFRLGGHAAEAGAFTLMRFPELDLPDVVYTEQLTTAVYLDKREDVELYTEVIERLSVQSEPPERTTGILSGILEEIRNDDQRA